LIYKEIYYI